MNEFENQEINKIAFRYQQNIDQAQRRAFAIKKQIIQISTIRMLIFVLGVAGGVYCWSFGWWASAIVLCVALIPFLVLIKVHATRFLQKEMEEQRILINQGELDGLAYNFSAFDGGAEYLDSQHLYSYDLDVFGSNSLFQSINRTVTSFGKTLLSSWFLVHLQSKREIESRQEAIKELTSQLDVRQQFQLLGQLYKGDQGDRQKLKNWHQTANYFSQKRVLRLLILVAPLLNVLLLALSIGGFIPITFFALSFSIFFLVSLSQSKKVSEEQRLFNQNLSILATYSALMQVIEGYNPQTSELKSIQKGLIYKKKPASMYVAQLSMLLTELDRRENMLVAAVLNGFLFWEVRQMIKIEAWKIEYATQLMTWIDAVASFDAINSLATFAYNHPTYSYPSILETPFQFSGQSLGHPLLNRKVCVQNGISIDKESFFIIITGANMAGKSTYLRTVAVNYLLGCIGGPVCGKEVSLYPSQLITSLRTSDSLSENESYFFAELKRLQLIIQKLQAGEQLFIVLDEILKGTNSVDKQKGSLALIKQLLSLQANGIIATHDLLLGSLIDLFPTNISNHCFEADITNDQLHFTYQMRDGVAKNMNACFLMKQMGIVIE